MTLATAAGRRRRRRAKPPPPRQETRRRGRKEGSRGAGRAAERVSWSHGERAGAAGTAWPALGTVRPDGRSPVEEPCGRLGHSRPSCTFSGSFVRDATISMAEDELPGGTARAPAASPCPWRRLGRPVCAGGRARAGGHGGLRAPGAAAARGQKRWDGCFGLLYSHCVSQTKCHTRYKDIKALLYLLASVF